MHTLDSMAGVSGDLTGSGDVEAIGSTDGEDKRSLCAVRPTDERNNGANELQGCKQRRH